jgi:hypothetical protein
MICHKSLNYAFLPVALPIFASNFGSDFSNKFSFVSTVIWKWIICILIWRLRAGSQIVSTVLFIDSILLPTSVVIMLSACPIDLFLNYNKARSGAVGWGIALNAGRSRVRFLMVSLEFFIDTILSVALWRWDRLSLLKKWVPGIFPAWSRRPVRRELTTFPPSCADYL